MIQLPSPAAQYDAQNEREARRTIALELASLRSALDAAVNTAAAGVGASLPLSGGTLTGSLGVGDTVLRKSTTLAGFGIDVPYAAALTASATITVGNADTDCLLFVTSDVGAAAIVVLTAGATTVLALRGTWSGVLDTAGAHNVYWTGAAYALQNKTLGSVRYTLTRIGRVPTL